MFDLKLPRHTSTLPNSAKPSELTAPLSGGKNAARKLKRAQILRAADAGASDENIATNVGGARPCTGPSAVLCSVTWRPRSAKSRALERTVSARVKRTP